MGDKILKGFGGGEALADELGFPAIPPGVRVVKEEVLQATVEARDILRRARDEAGKILEEARGVLASAEREREEEKGRGFQEGREAASEELVEKVFALENRYEELFAKSEVDLVRMVMEISEKVIGRELKKGAVVDVVAKAIAQAVGQKLVIHVNPSDLSRLRRKEKELAQLLEARQGMTLKEDETLTPGGCLIETELGTIDSRLETQLEAIRKALGLEGTSKNCPSAL